MRAAALMLLLACTACARNEPYTLYHSSVVDPGIRRDLKHYNAPKYNKENCEMTRDLFYDRPFGITQFIACEPTKNSGTRQ